MLTVQNVFDFINQRAPFDTQESFDNAGLLLGHPAWEVKGIHVAMDITGKVVNEAIAQGANLIITHHPVMFSARRRLVETDSETQLLCKLIRHNVALIAAHTNLDRAQGGINDVLATACGLTDVQGEDFIRVGTLPSPLTARQLADDLTRRLNTLVRVMGDETSLVAKVGMCSGAGSDYWQEALQLGAQAFLTGECKHHHALEAVENGMVILEAGHFATEAPGIFALADALQNWLDAVEYSVCVSKSQAPAYA